MKPPTLFILASITVNLALVALLLSTPAAPGDARSTTAKTTASLAANKSATLRAALASGDFAALRAAGMPEDRARDLALGSAYARYRAKLRAAQPAPDTDTGYWRRPNRQTLTAAQRALLVQAEREFADTLTSLLGNDASLTGPRDPRLAFLPGWKQTQVQRVQEDYAALQQQLRDDARSLPLPSDDENERRLDEQKELDLAALLTPEEREALELRASQRALNLMSRHGDGLENEEDWKTLYSANKAHDTKFPSSDVLRPGVNLAALNASLADTRKMYEQIHQTLGDERFAALQRATDADRHELDSVGRRLNFPSETTDRVIALRETYAAETQRIAADPALDAAQRKTQITALAAKARTELTPILGPEVTAAYALRPNWFRGLGQGRVQNTQPVSETFGTSALIYVRGSPGLPPQP